MGPSQPHSMQVHGEKYREPGEGYREAMNRIANALSDGPEHFKVFREIIADMRFWPAGRIQAAAGSMKHITMYNCFVSPSIHDSFVHGNEQGRNSIMDIATQAAATMRMGGGIGYDWSTLRPSRDLIRGVQSHTDGPLAFLHINDAVCRATSSAGNRRGAQMGVLRIDHPDILAFIRAKQPSDQLQVLWDHVESLPADHPGRYQLVLALQETLRLTGFNLSIAITDEFMECLASGRPFPLKFGDRVYNEVDPAELWEYMMRSTWDWAEPGVLFIDTINRMNNLWYCEKIAATNPCVPGYTPLLTRDGYVPIEETVGHEVEVWNGEEWSRVVPFSTGVNPLVTVSLDNGLDFECTPYHKFVLKDGSLAEAKDLQPGDMLIKTDMPFVEAGEDPPIDAYSQGFYSGDGSENLWKSFLYVPKMMVAERLKGVIGEVMKSGKAAMWYHGPMLSKSYVPVNATGTYCLEWLAGLLDADGCAVKTGDKISVQLSSSDHEFIMNVRLMLTRLGVNSRVAVSRPAGEREFNGKMLPCKTSYSLMISCTAVQSLMSRGMRTSRLELEGGTPPSDKTNYTRVVGVVAQDREVETFCLTESLRNRCVFNGLLTSQCGEQPLPPYGACLLGSFNAVRYIYKRDDGTYFFDYDQLRADIPPVVRGMDNVVDRSTYPLVEQGIEARNKRRMGLGITGLANAGEALGCPYGSPAFLAFERELLTVILHETYRASVQLAREKGAFPLFDAEKYCAGEFIKTLPADLVEDIRRYGIRNSHLTSIAPTGTISYAADNVSSGLEPVIEYEGQRWMNMLSGKELVDIQDYGVREFGVHGKLASQVTAQEHVDVLVTAAALVDSAVSKTCNVSPDMPWDDFKNIYVQVYDRGGKGCTTFNPGGKRLGIFVAKAKKAVQEDVDVETMVSAAEAAPEVAESCVFDPSTGRRSCE